MPEEVNLARPCDACGHYIGGGYYHCPKCKIYFCHLCTHLLTLASGYPPKCPMCGEEFK